MSRQSTLLPLILLINLLSVQLLAQSPKFKQSSYAGETVSLSNEMISINYYKRIMGWGWGEISTSDQKMMAVLEHFGEIKLIDQDIPMRLVSESYTKSSGPQGKSLTFKVKSIVVRDILEGTSFENWMVYPYSDPVLEGEVTFTLLNSAPILKVSYEFEALGNYSAQYIRGPWLNVGQSSFGTAKTDAILPGVDWAIDNEWTSGTDFFKDPWAMRVAPHPYKVTAPLMAISHEGVGIGLSWNPNQVATRWFNYRAHKPQPVFASPNFVDRKNNQLMGLMVPDASIEGHENEVYAKIPLELKAGQKIRFDAEIWLSQGNSAEVITDWVKRSGLPEPSQPRWNYEEFLDRVANAYNTHFWHEGKGFGLVQRPEHEITPNVPTFLNRYLAENKGTKLAKDLNKKVQWSQDQIKSSQNDEKNLTQRGERLLMEQNEDGSFPFNPDMIGKDDFKVATSFIEPMGLTGETALDITIKPATSLLILARKTGDDRFAKAAKKAFDYCITMQRPEAGDYWETPLHAANLLAAGHAAVGNYMAFEYFQDEKYREKAIYWMRTILAFTHLWEAAGINMLYNTKPVLSSSDWYFANWVRDHVQWEVLSVFADVAHHDLKWDEIDPEIDWLKFQKGITHAAMRWINLQEERKWLPHNLPKTYDRYLNGEYDYAFPDTHNSITGNYGGMMIPPAAIVENIYYLMDRGANVTD